jgi:hypothetical protein
VTNTKAKTPAAAAARTIHTNFGTIGPLQNQVRLLLGCTSDDDSERGAVLAFSHAGLPRIGRDLECHHFIVNCDVPFLVLAAKHHDACFYLLVNLADRASRAAFRGAYRSDGLEVVLVGCSSCPSRCRFAVSIAEERRLRDDLNDHEGLLRNQHFWRLQLGELTSRLPEAFSKLVPEAAACLSHHVVILNGDVEQHFTALRAAVNTALGSAGTSTI